MRQPKKELMFEKNFIFAYESSKMQIRNFVSGCAETEVHSMKKLIEKMLHYNQSHILFCERVWRL